MQYFEEILIILVMSFPVYIFWRWLYLKFIKDYRKRRIATWGSTILTAPLIYKGAIYLLLFWMFYYQAVDFEKQRWVARPGKRFEMSANIINSHMLIGKTKDQVKAMLGTDQNKSDSNTWFYYLGIMPGFAIDPDMLYIEFNNGKVTKVRQDPG